MLKILELTGEPFLWGGQEMFIMNSLRNMDMKNFVIDVLTPYQCGNDVYKKEIEEIGGKLISLNCSFSPNSLRWNVIFPLIKFLKAGKYDIVHIHSGSISVFAVFSLCAYISGVKRIIVHSHSTGMRISTKARLLKFLYYPILKNIPTDYLACSYAAGEWKFPSSILSKLNVIRNAIDLKKYEFNKSVRDELRKKLNLKNNTILLGHVGRFSFVKNHEFLIRILYEMVRQGCDVRLILVGGGELMDKVKRKVHDLNLDNYVIFVGEVPNVADYLQAMDVFVFPSLWEGLPIVGVEAQANGLPIVASNNISLEMKLTDSVTYLNLGNVEEWICEIKTAISKPRSRNIEELTQKGFDISSLSKTISSLYLNEY